MSVVLHIALEPRLESSGEKGSKQRSCDPACKRNAFVSEELYKRLNLEFPAWDGLWLKRWRAAVLLPTRFCCRSAVTKKLEARKILFSLNVSRIIHQLHRAHFTKTRPPTSDSGGKMGNPFPTSRGQG